MSHIDTSPAAILKLADEYLGDYENTKVMRDTLLAIAAEKEAQTTYTYPTDKWPVCGLPVTAQHHPEQSSPDERHLRRLLALRAAMPNLYMDDGEAIGSQHGISIDFMREPVADIDAKLLALNVARLECSKPEQQVGFPLDAPAPDPEWQNKEKLSFRLPDVQLPPIPYNTYRGEPEQPREMVAPDIKSEIKRAPHVYSRDMKLPIYEPSMKPEWKMEDPARFLVPADVPLPEPYDHINEWDTPLYVERDLDSAPKNGRPPNRSIPVFTTKQFLLGRDAYAKVKVAAERERCAQVAEDVCNRGRTPNVFIARSVVAAIRATQKGTV